MEAKKPLWTCPRCGQRFVTPNMLHSCGTWTIERFLEGKGPKARAFFDRFVELAGRSGLRKGGNWRRTGPSLSPRREMARMKTSTSSGSYSSFRAWVTLLRV